MNGGEIVGETVVGPSKGKGRKWELEGTHSPMCKRQKHEDWQHGQHGCAVGPEGPNHCDCKARWREIRPVDATKSGGLGE